MLLGSWVRPSQSDPGRKFKWVGSDQVIGPGRKGLVGWSWSDLVEVESDLVETELDLVITESDLVVTDYWSKTSSGRNDEQC